MKFYWGNVGSKEILEYMKEHNFRTLITSPHFRTPQTAYALDNGAYSDWKHNRDFRSEEFLQFLRKYMELDRKPEWVAVPDKVAQGNESLDFSLRWVDKIPDYFENLMLVVQDGMDTERVENHVDKFYGIFIGGTKRWKIDSAPSWVDLAHRHGKISHIGRISNWKEIMWAERIGVDSIDSTTWPQNYCRSSAHNIKKAKSQTTLEMEA